MAAHDPRDNPNRLQFEGDHAFMLPPIRRARASERDKRTYRACLHCRQRKSRCDLYGSGEPGKPPCERCIRENHECVLGSSHRGGRRVKRSTTEPEQPTTAPSVNGSSSDATRNSTPPPLQETRPIPTDEGQGFNQRLPSWPQYDQRQRATPASAPDPPTSHPTSTKMTVDESIASTNLQNPSDALEFLAHVAGRTEGGQSPSMRSSMYSRSPHQSGPDNIGTDMTPSTMPSPSVNQILFTPYQKGQVSLGMIRTLLDRYRLKYHQFYAVIPPFMFDFENIVTNAASEPHLLAAICTIASKDEPSWWNTHEACSAHMQQLIANLMYGGAATVGAVEALLVLAEWVPRPPQSMTAVGHGEEEQTAWMLSGMAIRMGYLLGIDRTGFAGESDPDAPDHGRRRLAWVGCYLSDRHISVRLGKAFWSRGPAMIKFTSKDFEPLQTLNSTTTDYTSFAAAHMELTQLFSNAHDVLYSSKNRSAQLNFGGEYVKYIDDFREAISAWDDSWGGLDLTSALKAGLIISYEYLRLYINAFAYQATLTRMAFEHSKQPPSEKGQGRPAFADFIAATPDARFIYDSIDAAKKILSVFNTMIDPTSEYRYMPLRYYLYVIYSAVFLYKARSTGVLGGDVGKVKKLVGEAVERLQRASSCENDLGDRYSRLLRLLWRKPLPQTTSAPNGHVNEAAYQATQQHEAVQEEQPALMHLDQNVLGQSAHAFTFSWLDLHAVGDFATNNGNMMDNGYENVDDMSGEAAYGHFDPGFVQEQQQHVGWNGYAAPGIIF